MKVQNFMESLSYSELSNTTFGNFGAGSVKEEYLGRVINQTNSALLELFTRFVVREKDLIIQSHDNISKYYLHKKHALTDQTPNVIKYIIDSVNDPFNGDLINVTSVSNEIGGELPLNDAEQWASVFTPQSDVLQLTHPGYGQIFNITYKARHPNLLYLPDDPDTMNEQEILIPTCLETPLRLRVAASIFSAMAGQETSPKTIELMQLYEKECAILEDTGVLGSNALSTNVKLMLRGWV